MMSFLNVFKKYIVTIATIIIPILVYLGVDLEILIKSVQEHTKTFIIIFAITLSILLFIIGIIIDDKKNKDIRIMSDRTILSNPKDGWFVSCQTPHCDCTDTYTSVKKAIEKWNEMQKGK